MNYRIVLAAFLALPITVAIVEAYVAAPHPDHKTVQTSTGGREIGNSLSQADGAAVQQEDARPATARKLKDLKRRVLVYLKGRQNIIAVHAAGGRPESQLVTVATSDGTVMAEEISTQEFQRLYPQLFQFYRTSYAEAWAGTHPSAAAFEPQRSGR